MMFIACPSCGRDRAYLYRTRLIWLTGEVTSLEGDYPVVEFEEEEEAEAILDGFTQPTSYYLCGDCDVQLDESYVKEHAQDYD